MNHQSFKIRFYWKKVCRELMVKTDTDSTAHNSPAVYRIYRNDVFLFSIFPTVDAEGMMEWELGEEDRAGHIPEGFANVLGKIIDEACINLEYDFQ